MRKICIDLSQDSQYIQKTFGGYADEHNETELEVILPERMLTGDISYYYFKFQTASEEEINSLNIYRSSLINGNKIVISLWEQLLYPAGDLTFCVCAEKIEENGQIASRGKTGNCVLQILKSPSGKSVLYNPEGNIAAIQAMINSVLDSAMKDVKNKTSIQLITWEEED